VEVYLYFPLCLYDKHADTFTYILAILIKILLKNFVAVKFIHNYAVY